MQEKEIARMVCLAFGQKVCGFDLLRSERGKSYVCDVNGWSFVKNSDKVQDAVTCLPGLVLTSTTILRCYSSTYLMLLSTLLLLLLSTH